MAEVDSSTGRLLIKAAKWGNEKKVRRLIKGGACVNAVDEECRTALMIVAKDLWSERKMAISLIKGGADVNLEDKDGNTALMHAITQFRKKDITLAIIEHSKDLDVNIVDNQGRTALMKAAIKGMTTCALELIKRGADVNMKDKDGYTALIYAIENGSDGTAAALISKTKDVSVNSVDNQSQTALMKAAINGMTSCALELIKRGADVNMKNKEGKTAVLNAIEYGSDDIAAALISETKDFSVNSVDNQGRTALMKAAIKGLTKYALELIKRGADVNMKDKEGKTALMYAIENGSDKIASALIRYTKDFNVNIVDKQGQTVLMTAIIKRMTEFALELIKCGVDVNRKDKEGKTALMFIGLAEIGFVDRELTLALLNAGADVNMTDYQGNTVLMYNVKKKYCVKALIEQGRASVDSRNNLGRTALFYALVESIPSARYLAKNGANLKSIDNYNVSVLSYVIHHCFNNEFRSYLLMDEGVDFFKENGIKKKTLENAIINAVFCKLLLLEIETHSFSYRTIANLLGFAAQLSKKRLSMFEHSQRRSYDDFVQKISGPNISLADMLIALDKLLDLGAYLNTSDEKGNTISHYIILLGIYNYKTEEAWKYFLFLVDKGLKINQKNCDSETPLLFMLSNAVKHRYRRNRRHILNMEYITKMCDFFLQEDPSLAKGTSQSGDSVFHLVIMFSNGKYINHQEHFEQIFIQPRLKGIINVNGTNFKMNTPLHIWAATSPGPSEKIFDHLLSCGVALHLRNLKGETPLHMCRTWTAVKLLVKSGAKTNDIDLTERSPLLSAAQKSLFLEIPGCFYPDVLPSELPTFWRTVMDMGFDLWTCDKNGDSIISNLIKGNSFELADGLIEIACDNSERPSDDTLLGVLNAICKDDSTQTTWKSILVGKLLTSTRRPLDVSAPLRSCCINIKVQDGDNNSVHYQIAKQLLAYRYDSAESCLDVTEGCPPLQALLSTLICIDDVPLVIPWTTVSKRHKDMLSEVARRQSCKDQGPYWYHNEYIASGAFSHVFVGIHEKDGMEVAVKKVNRLKLKDLREIRTFARLPNCEHIVRYLAFLETSEFSYIIMELMEGNLVEYFSSGFEVTAKTMLCRDVTLGLKYLHERNIIHRDLKPNNILFRTHPEFRLKIADFGLSRRLDINASFTVMATGVGTRGWIAPEVMKSTSEHSMSSDVFSLGLILHYVLSKDHINPFSPADCTGKSDSEIIPKTETNILNNIMEGWDRSLDPEASHLIKGMLNCNNEKERPTASTVSDHPMFWSKKKKLDFLCGVGNQEEFESPRTKRTVPLTVVEQDLEKEFTTIVKFGRWDDPRYTQTSVILTELKRIILRPDGSRKPVRTNYDYGTAVELVRFIRIAKAHVSEPSRPAAIKKQILEAVFLDEFPSLVLQVFKAVTAHGWDVSREEIKHVLAND